MFSANFQEFLADGKSPLGKGKLVVDDNDFPNVVIQLVNKRDRQQEKYSLAFPPPILNPASRPVTIDKDENSIARLWQGVARTFDEQQKPGAEPYMKFLSVQDENAKGDLGFGQFLANDPDFVNRNFRCESHDVSDTLPATAEPDESSETFGARNGFGSRAVVYCKEPLIEDVEYDVNIWAEDNVKYINDPRLAERIDPPYTGIKELEVLVSDQTQEPKLQTRFTNGPTRAFWAEPIRAIFREPVAEMEAAAGESELDEKFPFVEAKVRDFKGNQRSLKVYFWVKEEKSHVRILEQKQLKN